jgi:Ca2+-binding RTX toxin-like protein
LNRLYPPVGRTINHGIAITDGISDQKGDVDLFHFKGNNLDTVDINVARLGGGFQPCIELWGPTGIKIANACGGYPSYNSATISGAKLDKGVGRYVMIIWELGDNTTGTYSLSLQCLAGSCFSSPPTCNGVQATLYGSNSDDILVGTDLRDVIVGLGGNDIIHGLGGNDLICGDNGNDVLIGGPGSDILIGGFDNDTLKGNAGDDSLLGNRGNDTLNGGPDNDRLFGHGGNDTLSGGAGDDDLHGGSDDDVCDGGAGSDMELDFSCELMTDIEL